MTATAQKIYFRCPKCTKMMSLPADMKNRLVACSCTHKFQVTDKDLVQPPQPQAPPKPAAAPSPAASQPAPKPRPPAGDDTVALSRAPEPAPAPADDGDDLVMDHAITQLPADAREAVAAAAAAHKQVLEE